jgi:hypothetical protein
MHPGVACRSTRLLKVDPSTLRRRDGRALELSGYFEKPVSSPDAKAVALGGASGRIVLADVVSMRRLASIRIGNPYEFTDVVAWPAASRLVAHVFQSDAHRIGRHRIVVIDPARGRAVRELRLDQWWWMGGARTNRGRVALLVASSLRLGPPRLIVVGTDGRIHRLELDRLRAGVGYSRGAEVARFPGLAIDPAGERAFVLNQGEPVAIVDLETLSVRYRPAPGLASPPRALAGPARDTGTSNPRRGPTRVAAWLGDGLIAVSGSTGYTGQAARRLGDSEAPAGLQILDTQAWSIRTLDRRPMSFDWMRGRLIAYARAWDPRARRLRGDGLVAFDRRGRVVYRISGKGYWQPFNGRIYVDDAGSPLDLVLDARTGRRLGRISNERVAAVTGGYC